MPPKHTAGTFTLTQTKPAHTRAEAPSAPLKGSVVVESDRYARSMLGVIRLAVGIAATLYAMQFIFASIAKYGSAVSTQPRIPFPQIGTDAANASVMLLITAAVALQVFLRLPRDPERFTPDAGIAHRQFWGPIGLIVATGAALIALYSGLEGLALSTKTGEIDFGRILGIPVAATLALLFAADAASLSAEESRKSRIVEQRRLAQIAELETIISRIPGKEAKRPRRTLVLWSMALVAVTGSVSTWASMALLRTPEIIAPYAFAATMSAAILIPTCTAAITPALTSIFHR